MMKRKCVSLPLLVCLLFLVGCTKTVHKELSFSYIPTGTPPLNTTDKHAQDELAEAAVSVGHSLQQISAIQMAVHPNAKLSPPFNPETIGMAQPTSLQWTGPIEPLLKKIAGASHYRLQVLGKRPAIPVIITIDSKNVPLAEILRNATFQVQKEASITLYPSIKIIELRYHPS